MYKLRTGGIFLTVKDLMLLTGSNSYSNCSKQHKTIREAIALHKKKLTIREYCNYEKIDFKEIWEFLRVKEI